MVTNSSNASPDLPEVSYCRMSSATSSEVISWPNSQARTLQVFNRSGETGRLQQQHCHSRALEYRNFKTEIRIPSFFMISLMSLSVTMPLSAASTLHASKRSSPRSSLHTLFSTNATNSSRVIELGLGLGVLTRSFRNWTSSSSLALSPKKLSFK